jgi:hypothetical protein
MFIIPVFDWEKLRETSAMMVVAPHEVRIGNLPSCVCKAFIDSISRRSWSSWNRRSEWRKYGFLGQLEYVAVGHVCGVRPCLWTAATSGPIVRPPDDVWEWRTTMEWYWKRRTLRKTCPSATLSTTNLTWTDPGANPGLGGETSRRLALCG